MPSASLGKVMFSPICMSIIVYLCFKCVDFLFNINGKFCIYTGSVMCSCSTVSVHVVSAYL